MFVVLVLAAYRITRLIAVDDLTAPLRERARQWSFGPTRFGGPAVMLYELVTCPFCVGVWVSAAVVLFAANTVVPLHWEWVVLVTAAVAGGQSLCSAADARLTA